MIEREQWDEEWVRSYLSAHWHRLEEDLITPQQQLWCRIYLNHVAQHAKVLEIGCGGSQMMPFLVRHRQVEMWGIDYSPSGIELAQKGFDAEQVDGHLVLGDALEANGLPRSYFDVVYSLGVVEHFQPPSNIIAMKKFVEYLRPGGLMMTMVPNLKGLIGYLTRLFDLPLYNQHVPLNTEGLDAIHENAGLIVYQPAQYVGVFNFYVANTRRMAERIGTLNYRVVRKLMHTWQQVYIRLFPYRESRSFSPYVIGIYKKPE